MKQLMSVNVEFLDIGSNIINWSIVRFETLLLFYRGMEPARYWKLRLDTFMRHVRFEMQRGALENDATSEARFAIDIHNNCALQ